MMVGRRVVLAKRGGGLHVLGLQSNGPRAQIPIVIEVHQCLMRGEGEMGRGRSLARARSVLWQDKGQGRSRQRSHDLGRPLTVLVDELHPASFDEVHTP